MSKASWRNQSAPTTAVAAIRPDYRLRFIDAARGNAMLFVLLSHFGYSYFLNQRDLLPTSMRLVGMVASPTFAVISGLLIGFLYRTHANDFARLQIRFADRGLFLLAVGRLAILGADVGWSRMSCLFLTDTIGVWMVLEPWLVARIRPRDRVATGLALFTLTWFMILCWRPQAGVATVVKDTLFGSLTARTYGYSFPLLPWFAVAFASSALGDRLGAYHLNGDEDAFRRLLQRTAACALGAAAVLNAVYHAAKYVSHNNVLVLAVHPLASPFQKEPPSPVYMLFYGAIGLGLVCAWLHMERNHLAPRIMNRAVAFGQTSLVVFVIQWYVYFPLLRFSRGY